jgi:hypothetical protein
MGMQLLTHLKALNSEEKIALADFLWREADAQNAPDLPEHLQQLFDSRAEVALADPSKRFPLGDAEKKLRR